MLITFMLVIDITVDYLDADLDRLPLPTLGVCYSLCFILPTVHHRLRVFGDQLQWEAHPTQAHGARKRTAEQWIIIIHPYYFT